MDMNKKLALKALQSLDEKLAEAKMQKVTLIIGGGGSMILQHNYTGGSTYDIDAVPTNIEFEDLKPFMEKVAEELKIAPDWLNPYYSAFTIYLPADSKSRILKTYQGEVLTVKSLGAEDILIMKLMAGRSKDMPHIKHLMRMKLKISIVESRLEELKKLYPKEAGRALDRLDEVGDA